MARMLTSSTGDQIPVHKPTNRTQTCTSLASNRAHIAVASDGSSQFDGVIQEVAVYNYVLPHSRILAHYEAGIH
jgi:hypothetical protein